MSEFKLDKVYGIEYTRNSKRMNVYLVRIVDKMSGGATVCVRSSDLAKQIAGSQAFQGYRVSIEIYDVLEGEPA